MNRHDLVYVELSAWKTLIETSIQLEDPIVANWVDRGWPLVGRRANAGEGQGVALGLPLPPSAGKKRLAFLLQPEDVVAVVPPPSIARAIHAAPPSWRTGLLRLGELASQQGLEARVFGNLAWQAITGLSYVTDRSDVDFVLNVCDHTRLLPLAEAVARIEADAPMRLDGELIRGGSAVNWRELHAGSPDVIVKTVFGVTLFNTDQFLSGRNPT